MLPTIADTAEAKPQSAGTRQRECAFFTVVPQGCFLTRLSKTDRPLNYAGRRSREAVA
jgi:hypothetical protein